MSNKTLDKEERKKKDSVLTGMRMAKRDAKEARDRSKANKEFEKQITSLDTILRIKKIKAGREFKNYKELCYILGEKEMSGSSKIRQMANWERYFNYKKDGHKIIITDVFKKPIEKPEDKRGRNGKQSVMLPLFQSLIMYNLATSEHPYLIKSSKEMYDAIGLCNKEYIETMTDRSRVETIFGNRPSDKFLVNDFFDRTRKQFAYNISEALNNLKDNNVIQDWKITYKLFRKGESNETHKSIATKDEESQIDDVMNQAFELFGCKDFYGISKAGKQAEFWLYTNSRINEVLQISSHMKVYVIYFNKSKVRVSSYNTIESQAEYEARCMELNNVVRESNIKSAKQNSTKKTSNVDWHSLNSGIITESEVRSNSSGGYGTAPDYFSIIEKCLNCYILIPDITQNNAIIA